MSSEPRHNIRAGAAFQSATESDPATQAALQELRKAAENPEVQAVIKAQLQAAQECANALHEIIKRKCDSLAAKHFPRPKNIEDWEELARIVEIPKDSIGGLTAREIYRRAMEWAKKIQVEAKRRKIKALLEAKAEAEIAAPPTPQSPSASETKEATQRPIQGGFLGGEKLADALGIPRERRDAFFKQLERERRELGDNTWHEVQNPRPNAPRYTYLVDNPRLQDLAKRYREQKTA